MSDSLDYQFFIRYFNNFNKFEAKSFDLALQHAYSYASENGFSENDLILLAKISFSQPLGAGRLRKVIQTLIPRSLVPNKVVKYVIKWLLTNYNKDISPYSIKIVLQWLIGLIEYQLINSSETINLYYEIFWYLLPVDIVNISACNLIYLLAKPEDVNRWYVKQLLVVHERYMYPKYTGALLLLFKSYRPDCVPENIAASSVHKAFGALPSFMVKYFSKAQEKLENENLIPKEIESICWYSKKMKNVKKNALQLIPNMIESEIYQENGSKLLTSITNVKDLHVYLIQDNSPNKVLSLLNNLQGMFILMFGDNTLHERFSFQLYYTLYDAFLEQNPHVPYSEKVNLLNKINSVQNLFHQGIPVVSKFLAKFIIKWDGVEYENSIYGLLQWINFTSFEELHECIFNHIYDLFICGNVETKCKILNMLGRFTVNILTTYYHRIQKKLPCLFLEGKIEWKFYDVIFKLYEYVTNLCKLAWNFEKGHSLVTQTIIDINLMIMTAEELYGLQIWRLPNFLCHSSLFSSNPSVLLRICELFNRFPTYVAAGIKKDYVKLLFHKKRITKFDFFSAKDIEQLQQFSDNINTSLSLEKHLALSCFNYELNPENKNYDDFLKHATTYYPEVVLFIKNNV